MTNTVRSSEKQEQVQVYGNRTHIYLDEREIEIQGQDEEIYTQFEYSVVTLPLFFGGDALALGIEMFNTQKVEDLKAFLLSTDHKLVSDYELKEGETIEDIELIKLERSEARDTIREFKNGKA
jgi:hypothetical protein